MKGKRTPLWSLGSTFFIVDQVGAFSLVYVTAKRTRSGETRYGRFEFYAHFNSEHQKKIKIGSAKTHSLLYNDSLLKVKEMDMGVTHKPCGSPLYQLGKSKYKREIAKSDSAFISFYGS